MNTSIVCFGETLWDMLPSGNMPGGAPMNVAIHLSYHGFSPAVISRVGTDKLGQDLLTFLEQKGISTQWIQTDTTHQTGIVEANISDKHEVKYTIVEPVAWDFIIFDKQVATLVQQSQVFIYGSLAARNDVSRQTLENYLHLASLKVFDVNLRPPHYSRERIIALLQQAQIVKMNHHELAEIMNWHEEHLYEKESMGYLKNTFGWNIVIVTRGENGAAVLSKEGYIEHDGVQVDVEDTIGSGDAFLASFLSNYLQNQSVAESLKKACMAGAFVATQKGATPNYDPSQIATILQGE